MEAAAAGVARHHVETQPFPGRDLSPLLTGRVAEDALDAPVYFMTEDRISRGLRTKNRFTGEPFEPVAAPDKVESVIVRHAGDLWKLNHYYDTLGQSGQTEATESAWELHNLTADPQERTNLSGDSETATVRARAHDRARADASHGAPHPPGRQPHHLTAAIVGSATDRYAPRTRNFAEPGGPPCPDS